MSSIPAVTSPKSEALHAPKQPFQAAWGNVAHSSCHDPHAQIAPRCFFNAFQIFQPDSSQKKRSNSKSQQGDGDWGLSGLLCVTLGAVSMWDVVTGT